MHKSTPTEHPIHELIKKRWSPRAFDPKPVDQTVINSLFEAARWSASSMNEQPWRFIYANKGEEVHEKIVKALMPGNQDWAANAPILITTIIKSNFDRNGKPNRTAQHDLGLAVGNLSLQATAEEIGLHQMGGVDLDQLTQAFDLPDGYEPVSVIAAGYFGDPSTLPDPLAQRELAERKRMQIEEFAFHGSFSS